MKIDRRQLLELSGGLLIAAAFGSTAQAVAAPAASSSGSLPALFSDRAAAARLGALYLATQQNEADREILVARIAASIHAATPAYTCSAAREDLRQAVQSAIQADFAASRMVDVDGWLLARTEARLYALAHLGHKRPPQDILDSDRLS